MIDKIAFLFTEGLKSFLRNKLTNFLCIITILINFTILGTFFIAGFNTENLTNFFRSKYTFEIFLQEKVDLDQSNTVIKQLESNPVISSIVLIDKDKSADIFLEEFGEDVVDMLGYNPLPMSLKVSLEKSNFDLNKIELLISEIEKYDFVEHNLDNVNHIHDYGLYIGNHPELSRDEIEKLCYNLNVEVNK